MPQFLRPGTPSSNPSGFVTQTGSSTLANLAAAINEASPNDSDFVEGLGTIVFPLVLPGNWQAPANNSVTFRYRRAKPSNVSATVNATVTLLQGGSAVGAAAVHNNITTGWVEGSFTRTISNGNFSNLSFSITFAAA